MPVGQYSIGLFDAEVIALYNSNNSIIIAESGSISITAHDLESKTMEGTFSFVVQNADTGFHAEITDGKFVVQYSEQ